MTRNTLIAHTGILLLVLAATARSQQETPPQANENEPTVHYVHLREVEIPWAPPSQENGRPLYFFKTINGGRRWIPQALPTAIDGKVSFRFNADGRYGFRIVQLPRGPIRGLISPKPGIPPQFEIVVDTQAPVARWNLPPDGILQGPPITLRWNATDKNMDPEGIRGRPRGPGGTPARKRSQKGTPGEETRTGLRHAFWEECAVVAPLQAQDF